MYWVLAATPQCFTISQLSAVSCLASNLICSARTSTDPLARLEVAPEPEDRGTFAAYLHPIALPFRVQGHAVDQQSDQCTCLGGVLLSQGINQTGDRQYACQ
jgi:hypothetical protein